MKTTFAMALILISFAGTVANANEGDCTDKLLLDAVRANCGKEIKIDKGIIGHYEGEVIDTWIFSVKKGSTKKNLKVDAEGGNCVPATIQLDSQCP